MGDAAEYLCLSLYGAPPFPLFSKSVQDRKFVIASTVNKQRGKKSCMRRIKGGGKGAKPQMQTYFDVYTTYLNNVTHKAVFL